VNPATGKEIQGTRKGPGRGKVDCESCETKLKALKKGLKALMKGNRLPILGAYMPQCTSDGGYKKRQCRGSTGTCWCVNPVTGMEINGTRKTLREGPVTCGPCEIELSKANGIHVLGAFTPTCTSDGGYKRKQCRGSTGFCWCVNPATGKEIQGTRKGPGRGKVTCDQS